MAMHTSSYFYIVGAFIRLILHTGNNTGVPIDPEGGLYKADPLIWEFPLAWGWERR